MKNKTKYYSREDIETYSSRILEEISGNYSITYVGTAQIGSSETNGVWKIIKIAESGSTTEIKYANGNNYYDNIWLSASSLNYY